MKNKIIVVWFSCGAASAIAAKQTIELYGKDNIVRVVNNPIKEEHHDNQRFLKDVEKWLGVKIETSTNSKYPNASCVEVWDKRKYMSGIGGAPCTLELKKNARKEWEKENHHDFLVLGFTVEEKKRHDRFKIFERENILPVLIESNTTKQDCFNVMLKANIDLPAPYKLGFSNANCIGCVKSSSPTYWNLVREHHKKEFDTRAEQSRRIGCKLIIRKGVRIFLDELKKTDKSRDLKKYAIDCGIFCEELDD